VNEAIEHILELIAPGQTDGLKFAPADISRHVTENEMIQTVSNILLSELLSIVATRFSKEELEKHIPVIRSYKYYQAKKLSAESAVLSLNAKNLLSNSLENEHREATTCNIILPGPFICTISQLRYKRTEGGLWRSNCDSRCCTNCLPFSNHRFMQVFL
jgi:hypothetical protein